MDKQLIEVIKKSVFGAILLLVAMWVWGTLKRLRAMFVIFLILLPFHFYAKYHYTNKVVVLKYEIAHNLGDINAKQVELDKMYLTFPERVYVR